MRLLARGLHHLLLLLNVGVALASVLTYAASYISPDEFWYLFFLTYAALPLLFVHFAFVLYWGFRRDRLIWLSAVTLVLGFPVNNRLLQYSSTSSNPNEIRVMSYNIGSFMENGRQRAEVGRTKSSVAELIRTTNPHILCFQEYSSQARGRHDITDFLLDTLGYKSGYFEKIRDLRHEGFAGMAIFSRYPMIQKRFVPFKSKKTTNALIYADLVIEHDTVRVINIHLQSNRLRNEEYTYVTDLADNNEERKRGLLKIMGKLRDAARERAVQSLIVEEQVNRSPYPVILCGDFNDLPSSYAYQKVRGELNDSFIAKGNGIGNTYAGIFPSFRIDHIFASSQFEFFSHQVLRSKFSDHYPVLSSLYFATEE